MAKLDSAVMKRTLHGLGLLALFLVSFVVFLFLTFPYEVLKEAIAAEVSQASGYSIRIGSMSAGFPLGINSENVRIEAPSSGSVLTLKSLDVDIGLLSLLIGNLATDVEMTAGSPAGELDLDVDFSIFDLIGGTPLPKHIALQAKNFPLDEAFAFGLGVAGNGPNANPMLAPLLSAVGISASLNGVMDFNLNARSPTESSGHADLTLAKAVLKLSHPSLGLPDQTFKRAGFKAKVENGSVVLDKTSGLVSDELEVNMDGKITLKPNAAASLLDLKVLIKLNAGLKEKFGFIMDAVTGSATSEGQLTMQVRGPVENPAVTTF